MRQTYTHTATPRGHHSTQTQNSTTAHRHTCSLRFPVSSPTLYMPVSQHTLWSVKIAAHIRTGISIGCAGIANTPSMYRIVCTHVEYPIATLFSPSSKNTHK